MRHFTQLLMLASAGSLLWGQSPDGLYLMTRYWPGQSLETATYWFHAGTVVINPVGSSRTLDVQAERARHPKEVGTYQIQGSQLVANFAGNVHNSKLEPETKGCFGWDAGIFCPVEVFKPGTTLEGAYSGGASVGYGAVASSTTITFHRDGTYQRESVGTIAARSKASTITAGSTGTEQGRYRIDGTAMHMMPQGGQETVVSTFPWDDGTPGAAPRRVYFGGALLKRVQ